MKNNTSGLSGNIKILIARGVNIPHPYSVEIGQEVDPDRISGNDVCIYPGSRIYGGKTVISKGARLGYESPVTVIDCHIGPHVALKGGFLKSSVFLEGASVSSGALVREGCLLEEQANAAHTVGLKQTILFPFVTLGSLINFCDCLMAGGTSRKDHSEVGSSYIHFNYTPNQDKATPSLVGDVAKGVMLRESPIFLGGQGGLVGPVRIGYGTVIAAGTVYRKDCPEGGKLSGGGKDSASDRPFHPGFYGEIDRRVYNNIVYLANLLALKEWYIHIRQPFFQLHELGEAMYVGAIGALESMIEERLNRFRALSEKMETSIALGEKGAHKSKKETLLRQKKEFFENWQSIEACFTSGHATKIDEKNRDAFIETMCRHMNKGAKNYLQAIQNLDQGESTGGTQWLQNIVDGLTRSALSHLPSFTK